MCNLKDNLEDLTSDLEDLKAKRDDVIHKVNYEELKGRQRKAEVARWFSKVEAIETDINLLAAEARATYHSLNMISAYSCGNRIPDMLSEVKSLSSTEDFEELTVLLPPSNVLEDNFVQQTFGLDTQLHSTWNLLMQGGIRMLGLYGMGGVGKTTMLNQIYNNFDGIKDQFDVVIRVKVPRVGDIKEIQDDIGKRLGIYDENWGKTLQREKASDIRRVLKDKKRFVLLLDDLWKEVSLTDIGIPVLGTEYKIVFATRSKDVCRNMEADEDIEVQCLAEEGAWDLFVKKARCVNLNDNRISDIAKKIVAKCGGLPLAIEVIGKTLAYKTTERDWLRALNTLECSPSEWKDTEDRIFQVLKLSYDHLEKKDAKLCFQYCALFPKAYNIEQDELVEYWIGEDILDDKDGRQKAMDRGYEIISTLVEASLLLEDDEGKKKVYMHNMIQEMAYWIVVGCGGKFIVQTGAKLTKLPEIKNWKTVTKMSLMNNEIESIPDSSRLPNPDHLKTLFLQKNMLVDIGCRFFQILSTLVVLDLSRNPGIIELPSDISKLVSLRYLNLSGTRINNLQFLKHLIELIHLDLESTTNLRSLSLITGLLKLQVLRFYASAPLYCSLLEKLEAMNDLEILTITLTEVDVLEAFLGSKLAECTEGLYLDSLNVSGVSGKSFAATFGELSSLSKLGMTECNIIELETEWGDNQNSPSTSSNQITPRWFKNLSAVVLLSCVGLKDVTWLIYAENLESLSITTSPKMEEVISKEKAEEVKVKPFLKLEFLYLDRLDELKSIYWSPLSFPRLQKIHITNCPKLRKLPLNSTSVEKIDDLTIEVDEGWLEKVEWENGAKDRFCAVNLTVSVSQLHPV